MTIDEARVILAGWIDPDGSLRGNSTHELAMEDAWISWHPDRSDVIIDGACTAIQLTAIIVWMTQTMQGEDHDH